MQLPQHETGPDLTIGAFFIGVNSVVYRKTADLIPYARNARTHSDEQVTQIASSIKEFGFNNPILIDGESGVIAGHGRLMAAKKLGLETVPTIELSELSEAQKRAYILADNKIALNSDWDSGFLSLELKELSDIGSIDQLLSTGFDQDEIDSLLQTGETDFPELSTDEAPASKSWTFNFENESDFNWLKELIEAQIDRVNSSDYKKEDALLDLLRGSL